MVSDDFLPNPGGIAAHVYELSRALAELGHEVDLITGYDVRQVGQLPELPPGVRVLQHRAFRWNSAGYLGVAAASARAIRRARRERHYDVCHWHSLIWETWAVAAAARGMPRVFTNHSSGYLRRARSKLRLHTQLRAIMRVPHWVITPSRELLERSLDAGFPSERVRYIPNGVDVRSFRPGPVEVELARSYGLREGDRVVIAPRRLDPKNGIDVLVRAVPALRLEVPNLKVLLVGDGPQRPMLERIVKELGVESCVVFCGSQPRAAMQAHLRLGHVCALPSRAEAVSLAGLEAMAVGLPVVGSRVGGIPEFVRESETGSLVGVDDHVGLAHALARILRDDVFRESLGRAARESVEQKFSWRATAEQTLAVYRAAAV
jgi:glycosyltransferase involved in cell wall biosynthesis